MGPRQSDLMGKRKPGTYTGLEDLGRTRLSPHFFMRDFLYSELGNFFAKPNIPIDPDLAIVAGKNLCAAILDPLTETFGPLHIRSSYRSPDLNHFGATEAKPQKCSRNEANYAGHIWDMRDGAGRMGATACIAVPWFADQFKNGRDWRDLAWWIHDHVDYHQLYFFPKLAAFNVTWREAPERSILSYIAPKGKLYADGKISAEAVKTRQARYADFPPFRGIKYPKAPT